MRATARAAVPRRAAPTWRDPEVALAILACVALGLWVHRRVLGGFFAPDDFIYLERAAHLRHDPISAWRVLPGQVYFRIVGALFAGRPERYFACNLLLHSVNVTLVFAWIRRWRASVAAATLGAGWFATTHLAYTTLAQAATVSELMVTGLTLGSLLVTGERGRWRAFAGFAGFAAALLCKESVALVPLVLALAPWGTARRRIALAVGMTAMGVLWGLVIASSGMKEMYSGGAYEAHFGVGLFHNLMTYADWSTDFTTPVPDLFGTFSTTAWRSGVAVLAVWAVIAVASWRRQRSVAAGLAWWTLGLVPVLPLLYHSFLHYLYLPAAGLALGVAGVFEWARGAGARAASPARAGAMAWGVAGILLAAHAVSADRLLAARGQARVTFMDLPVDPFQRKTLLAERSVRGLDAALDGQRTPVGILLPRGPAHVYGVLLRDLMDQGRAFRLLVPGVDSVLYVEHWSPAANDLVMCAQSSEGDVRRLGSGPAGFAAWLELLHANGFDAEARDWIAEARRTDAANAALADTLTGFGARLVGGAGESGAPGAASDLGSSPLRFAPAGTTR